MTLKDVQIVSLDIMKDIHDFCVKNNIRYTLGGGTLIGCIRHNGFIPWDDDIDINMPRPDYEKFCKLYHEKGKYRLFSYEHDKTYIGFGRVCDMNKTYVKTLGPWCSEETGIWIDIFPIDGAGNTHEEACKRILYIKNIAAKVIEQRRTYINYSDCTTLKQRIGWIIRKLRYSNKEYLAKQMRLVKELDFDKSEYIANQCFLQYGTKHIHHKLAYSSYILHKFEDTELYVIADYDNFLREQYGDYMKLPPVEKRIAKHDFIKYYWK